MLHTQVSRPVAFTLTAIYTIVHFTAAFIPLVGILGMLPVVFHRGATSFERQSAFWSAAVYAVGVFFAPVALVYGFISGALCCVAFTALPPKEYYQLRQLR